MSKTKKTKIELEVRPASKTHLGKVNEIIKWKPNSSLHRQCPSSDFSKALTF